MSAWIMYEIVLLALTAWREARNQSRRARQGVMWVIKTRADHPRWWGHDVVSVIVKPAQFTSIVPPHWDVNLKAWPDATDHLMQECLEDAQYLVLRNLPNPFPTADSYYDTSIPAPAWTQGATLIGEEGVLRFYAVAHLLDQAPPAPPTIDPMKGDDHATKPAPV